jgi:hypothetical protein
VHAEPFLRARSHRLLLGAANVPWCKLQRGPACVRRSGATAAVIRGASSAAKSMSAGVPPVNYRWTEAARPPGAANGPLPASHQSWAAIRPLIGAIRLLVPDEL